MKANIVTRTVEDVTITMSAEEAKSIRLVLMSLSKRYPAPGWDANGFETLGKSSMRQDEIESCLERCWNLASELKSVCK